MDGASSDVQVIKLLGDQELRVVTALLAKFLKGLSDQVVNLRHRDPNLLGNLLVRPSLAA